MISVYTLQWVDARQTNASSANTRGPDSSIVSFSFTTFERWGQFLNMNLIIGSLPFQLWFTFQAKQGSDTRGVVPISRHILPMIEWGKCVSVPGLPTITTDQIVIHQVLRQYIVVLVRMDRQLCPDCLHAFHQRVCFLHLHWYRQGSSLVTRALVFLRI